MEVGIVRVAEDKDFHFLKTLIDNHSDWKLDYNKGVIKVWTKNLQDTNFKMVKVIACFTDIEGDTLFDVLHDPEYRKEWDAHMIDSHDIGFINPNNDVGYYSMSCPSPLNKRDFVLQRSWLDMGNEKYILNHSVHHAGYPPRKGFIRATSHLTGFLIRSVKGKPGCSLGYISQTDPRGQLPPWLVNRVTQIFGPKMVKNLQKASWGYEAWKAVHNPYLKPWLNPEQISAPRLRLEECKLTPESICEEIVNEEVLSRPTGRARASSVSEPSLPEPKKSSSKEKQVSNSPSPHKKHRLSFSLPRSRSSKAHQNK